MPYDRNRRNDRPATGNRTGGGRSEQKRSRQSETGRSAGAAERSYREHEYTGRSAGEAEEARYRQYEYSGRTAPTGGFRSENGPEGREDREERDRYILTGRNPIREALKNHRDLEKLLVQKGELSGSAKEIVQKAREQKVQIQVVEKSRLDEIAPHHQGLIAFASAYQYSTVEEILETARERGEEPFLVLLDGVTDPHNLGAIIRTAECAGVHGIIVPQHHSVGLSPAAVKASAGAVEYVKVARVTNLSRTIEMLQKENIWVYAVTMDGTDYRKADFSGGVALVIGSEEDGISRLTGEKCDGAVSLPMAGKIESLNASVAAGIMMYQVFSSRG